MGITFILNTVPAPHVSKRIKALASQMPVKVICARRKNMDIYEPEDIQNVSYSIKEMNIPPASSPFKRLKAVFSFALFVKRELKETPSDIIYVVGLDTLCIACAFGKKNVKICYDVADLRESFTNARSFSSLRGILDSALQSLERRLSKKVSLLILTSKKFYDVHYKAFIPSDKVIEIPNMPNRKAFENYRIKNSGDFTIGFVGALRYITQMYMLVDVAGELGIKVIFSGATDLDVNGDFRKYCNDKPWVTFTGRYNFMEEIAGIYGRLDCIYSVYDAANFNVRVALPNKLYEAALCHLPIIVAKNTYLCELVESWGTGVGIEYDSPVQLKDCLRKLMRRDEYYDSFVKHTYEIDDKIDIASYLMNFRQRVNALI